MFGKKTTAVLCVAVSLIVPASALATAPVNGAAFPPLTAVQHCNKAGAKIGILLCSWPSLRTLVIKGHANVRGGAIVITAECGSNENPTAFAVTSSPLGESFTYKLPPSIKAELGAGVDCNVTITLDPAKPAIAINGTRQIVSHMYIYSLSASYTRR